jgi:amino acid adenylation domain-containing protein
VTECDLASRPASNSSERGRICNRIYLNAMTAGAATAIEHGSRSITYASLAEQLDVRCSDLSDVVKSGVFVALEHRRSIEFVVDFLAVLRLGGVPVPIDPDLPARRRATLLGLVPAGVSLGRTTTIARSPGTDAPALASDAAADGAYVFFTSGSTGTPKPVLGSASALRFFLEWQSAEFDLGPRDRVGFLTALSFDVAVRDIFLPLWIGATLVIPEDHDAESPETTVSFIDRKNISVVNVVPSVARGWLRYGRARCDSLRTVFFAGEPMTAGLLDEWHTMFPRTRLRVNFYGTTETTLPKVYRRLGSSEEAGGNLPAGRPLPGTRTCLIEPGRAFGADLVRAALDRSPEAGEIVLVSRHAGHGYVGMPVSTAARFVDLGGGVTAYRTGDLGRVDEHGELVVIGRADDEVKINGVRLHPAEVAAAIRGAGQVRDVFVTAPAERGPRLIAFVVPAGGRGLDVVELRRLLLATLPPAMIPTRFVELAELPALPNGKIDRNALRALAGQAPPESRFRAPEGDVERRLATQWAELFGRGAVSTTDDFFDLGGDSLSAMQLASRIRRDHGVSLSAREILAAPTITALSAVITDRRRRSHPVPGGTAIPLVDRSTGRLPMSFAQRRLHFLQTLDPDSSAYNVVEAIRLSGPLDVDAVRAAVATVVSRHEVLRTRCSSDGPEPELVIADAETVDREQGVDVVGLGEPELSSEDVRALFARLADRPFRLDTEFPLRVTLARVAPDDHAVLFVAHHIATDAWSSRLLVGEFLDSYAAIAAGSTPALEPLPLQYADFADWQREQLDDDVVGVQLGYWRERLTGMPPVLELPLLRRRPAARSDRGAEVHVTLDRSLVDRVRAAARGVSVTPFVVLLTAFGYVLHRHCATDDVVVGTPVAGRDRPEFEQLLGCFINTLVLRMGFAATSSLRDLVRQVGDTTLDAYEHRDLPFERLVAELGSERDLSTGQLVQVMFNHYAAAGLGESPPGLAVGPFEIAGTRARFDLSCTVVEAAGTLRATLTYAVDVLSHEQVTRIGEHFLEVLATLVTDLDAPATSLPGVPAADIAALRRDPVRAPDDGGSPSLLARFEAHAAADPEWPAVRCRDEVIDYGRLNGRANRLARHLVARGTAPGDQVALLFERSIDHVTAMLAVQKAGATYVPLDPAVPANHLVAVLAETSARLLLTHTEVDAAARAALAAAPVRVEVLDEITEELARQLPEKPDGRGASADEAMYVVFTSGSTGRPKGVVVEHRQFTHYLTGILDLLDVPDKLSFALVSTLAADLGLTNLYGALATGGTAHMVPYEWAVDPEQLAGYFRRHRIDFLKLVPSHLQAVHDAGLLADVVPARYLMLAGEACPWDLVDAVRAVRPDCSIWNTYGPTETTVAVLAHRVPDQRPPGGSEIVPIGSPIGRARAWVVDPQLRPVPIGAAGELLIAGPSVARGYLSADEPGAQRFVGDPFSDDPDARAYRSGDRARLLPEGTFEFLGRLDRQAKIRGYRVEPGYVEAVLRDHPAVADAAVAVREDRDGRARLVAYCVRAPGRAGAVTPSPREFATSTLPPYMVPAAFVELDRFPLTPNGKLDWRALPEPGPQLSGDRSSAQPRHDLDHRIAAIWRDLLDVADIGIDDDFFAAGGDSFSAMRLARRMGDGLRVATIFQHPTIRGLADILGTRENSGLLCRMSGGATGSTVRATVVAVPFGGGNAAAYGELARALPAEYPLYAVDPPGHDFGDPSEALEPFDVLARRCVTEIRETVAGPILVYGHCLGAALAFDIARRLRAEGGDVVGVVFGGAFPAPRLPGRIVEWWARLVPSDRWRSDRLYRDTLRGIGGLTQEMEAEEQAFILRALRHDSRQAEAFYTDSCHGVRDERVLPALAVVGELDRLTEFHEERHHEWDLLCAGTELEVIPDAGHFFLKHQAAQLAAILTRWVEKQQAAGPRPAVARPPTPAPRSSSLWGFALVTLGQLVSMVGTRALMFGLGVWVYLETGSATQFSVILVCGLLPALLVLPFAGAAADRWNRRSVMIAGDLVAVLGTGLCLVMFATGSLQVWHLYLATGLGSIAASFQQPAYLAAVAQLVPKQYLGRTNGVTQALVAMSQATGPLLGGALIVLVGLGGMLVTDLVTVFVSLLTLMVVRFPDTLFRRREESIWQEIAGGVRYIARRRSFVAMIVYFLAFNLILGFAIALVPPMALSFASAGALSVASTLGAVGGIVGGVAMALWGGFARRATGMVGFTLLTGIGMIAVGARPSVPLLALGLAGIAASLALLNGHWQTMIQTKVGMELQGRILASNRMIANLTEPLGYFCAGILADAFFEPAMREGGSLNRTVGGMLGVGPGRGMALMIVILGTAQVLLAVVGLRWRTLHHMEDALPDAIPGAVITWDRDALQEEADQLHAAMSSSRC